MDNNNTCPLTHFHFHFHFHLHFIHHCILLVDLKTKVTVLCIAAPLALVGGALYSAVGDLAAMPLVAGGGISARVS